MASRKAASGRLTSARTTSGHAPGSRHVLPERVSYRQEALLHKRSPCGHAANSSSCSAPAHKARPGSRRVSSRVLACGSRGSPLSPPHSLLCSLVLPVNALAPACGLRCGPGAGGPLGSAVTLCVGRAPSEARPPASSCADGQVLRP